MVVIVAGSRTITDIGLVLDAVESSGFEITGIISGCAPGVDTAVLMKPWACLVIKMPADWTAHGKSAGYRRNAEMGKVGEGLVAIWDGRSRGTGNMVSVMQQTKKPNVVVMAYEWNGRNT